MNDSRKLAGQLIMVRLAGTELDAVQAAFLKDNGIRAACLFRQNMVDAVQLSRLNARAAQEPRPPVRARHPDWPQDRIGRDCFLEWATRLGLHGI